MSIDDRLHGTWRVLAFEFTAADGAVFRPLGNEPEGGIVFAPDGHLSFAFFAADRPRFAADDLFCGSDDECAMAARGAVVFGGACRGEGGVLIVDIGFSLFPNWVGGTQRRLYHVEDDRLRLRTEGARMFGGIERRGEARLVRALNAPSPSA